MLVKRNMQIPMDFECFGIARRERPLRRKSPEKKAHPLRIGKRVCPAAVNQPSGLISVISKNSAVSLPLTLSTFSSSSSVTCWSTMRAPAVM